MSEQQNSAFGKFIPGFDFLQSLAKGASQTLPQMPSLSSWVAPTLNLEELEKRIGELKAVHFWLEQNSVALGATIQALEVQKMTLATLKGMNFSMAEVAEALKFKTPPAPAAAPSEQAPASGSATDGGQPDEEPKAGGRKKSAKSGDAAAQPHVVDPLQWWGALTQQFQQIASSAMQDAAAAGAAKQTSAAAAPDAATRQPDGGSRKTAPRKRPARKPAGR